MRVRSFIEHNHKHTVQNLVLRTACAGSMESVFAAWNEGAQLKHWVGGKDFKVSPSFRELRQDGPWSIQVKSARRRVRSWFGGVVLEHDSPDVLKFSLACEDPIEVSSPSIVTVKFKTVGDRTQIEIHHAGFGSESERRAYRSIWAGALSALRKYMTMKYAPPARPAIWDSLSTLMPFKDRGNANGAT